MPRRGRSLERLIASLEEALGRHENVTVKSPQRLPDRTTGKPREHDVVLNIKQGHHSLVVAIECRDRSRPITVNEVEGFWAKCQETGIDQGIIVSSKGFYRTAREKAAHYGIRCLGIEEVESFDWLLAPNIHRMTKSLIHTDWTFFPEEDGIVDRTNLELLDVNGNVVTESVLTGNARQQLDKLPHPLEPTESSELRVRFEGQGLVLRNIESGAQTPLKFAIATIRYSVVEELIPFRLVQYRDNEAEENITDAAIAELNLGEQSGRVVIHQQGAGGGVIYIPDSIN